jgi:hypothetical protein
MPHDMPPPTETENRLKAIMQCLEQFVPDTAIMLLLSPNCAPLGQRVNWICNCDRKEAAEVMRELLDRWDEPHRG